MQSERRLLEGRLLRLQQSLPNVKDDDLRAEVTKHFCVLASGLLEVASKDILARYSMARCAPQVQRFVESRLGDLQSAKIGNIHAFLTSFDPNSADRWLGDLSDEDRDSVDSIVNNRHQIAHGRSIGMSFDTLVRYFGKAQRALAVMERYFPPYKGA